MTARCPRCGFDPAAVVTARWERFFPRQPPSQNEIGKSVGARKVYKHERDAWTWEMRAWRLSAGGPTAASGVRRIFFERLYTGRQQARDLGNLIGGMKPVLDAVKLEGLIVDDAPKWLIDAYSQRRDELRSGLLVTLEELEA